MQYVGERKFNSKQIKELILRMNYHHMRHKSEGGSTTLENGAVVNELEHRYMHSLPRSHEEVINNHIRKWKIDYMTFTFDRVMDFGEISEDNQEPKEYVEIKVHNYFGFSKKQLRRIRRRQEKKELREKMKEFERE